MYRQRQPEPRKNPSERSRQSKRLVFRRSMVLMGVFGLGLYIPLLFPQNILKKSKKRLLKNVFSFSNSPTLHPRKKEGSNLLQIHASFRKSKTFERLTL